jgi:hypothetical protein
MHSNIKGTPLSDTAPLEKPGDSDGLVLDYDK